jgi:hypothetical protein
MAVKISLRTGSFPAPNLLQNPSEKGLEERNQAEVMLVVFRGLYEENHPIPHRRPNCLADHLRHVQSRGQGHDDHRREATGKARRQVRDLHCREVGANDQISLVAEERSGPKPFGTTSATCLSRHVHMPMVRPVDQVTSTEHPHRVI